MLCYLCNQCRKSIVNLYVKVERCVSCLLLSISITSTLKHNLVIKVSYQLQKQLTTDVNCTLLHIFDFTCLCIGFFSEAVHYSAQPSIQKSIWTRRPEIKICYFGLETFAGYLVNQLVACSFLILQSSAANKSDISLGDWMTISRKSSWRRSCHYFQKNNGKQSLIHQEDQTHIQITSNRMCDSVHDAIQVEKVLHTEIILICHQENHEICLLSDKNLKKHDAKY